MSLIWERVGYSNELFIIVHTHISQVCTFGLTSWSSLHWVPYKLHPLRARSFLVFSVLSCVRQVRCHHAKTDIWCPLRHPVTHYGIGCMLDGILICYIYHALRVLGVSQAALIPPDPNFTVPGRPYPCPGLRKHVLKPFLLP